jgi:hypothetical protein
VPVGLVDLAEIVEVQDGQRQAAVVAGRPEPLALELLLERAMVAESRERVPQRLGARSGVGVLEHDPGSVEPLCGLQDPFREPDREHAEGERDRRDPGRRQEDRGAVAERERVDDRRGQRHRDREHRDERQEQAQPNDTKVGRPVEDRVLRVAGVWARDAGVDGVASGRAGSGG